jgi:hydroxyacylglutathione hydrolase
MMKLMPLPALADNYIWLLHDGAHALVIDPGDAQPVLDALQRERVQLQGIVVTHHHNDHINGVDTLRRATGARVLGAPTSTGLVDGQRFELLGLHFTVLAVPGHTLDHLAYYVEIPDDAPILFCGDTLFSGGCGRVFEGTMPQMHHALARFATLPDNTRVCCAHEYTVSNLKFAREADPDNPDLVAYQRHCEALRAQGLPTLPSTIGLEKKINPFLRGDLATFTTLRQWKNQYR